MSRIRTLFTIVLPSMLAGGLIFSNAFTHAAVNVDDDPWSWSGPVADSGGGPPLPPAPPAPPAAPRPPHPPHPPRPGVGGPGVSVTVRDGKVQINGVDYAVRHQLDAARAAIRTNRNIPEPERARILARLDRIQATVDRRLANLKVTDIDQIGDELEKMGEEVEEAMEGLEDDLERLGEDLGKNVSKDISRKLGKGFAKQFKFDFDVDVDDDLDNIPMTPDLDADDADLGAALDDLKGLALRPQQRDAITRLRVDSDRNVAAAKQQIDETSAKLEAALADTRSSDADIARYVDQISAQEAAVRKARILAWVNARRVLDDAQRKKIEAAAKQHVK